MINDLRILNENEITDCGIKRYFEYAKDADLIKSLSLICEDNYFFDMFVNPDTHTYYINNDLKKLGYDSDNYPNYYTFSCENRNNTLSLTFNSSGNDKSLFAGKCIIKALREFEQFLKENERVFLYKKIELCMSDDYYINNVGVQLKTTKKEEMYKMINKVIASIYYQYNERLCEIEIEEQERIEAEKPFNRFKAKVKSIFK